MSKKLRKGKLTTPAAPKPEKSHLEIVLLPGESPEWIFVFSNKGLSRVKHGQIYQKKFASGQGSMAFNFCNVEQFDKIYKPKVEAVAKKVAADRKREIETAAAEKAIEESPCQKHFDSGDSSHTNRTKYNGAPHLAGDS